MLFNNWLLNSIPDTSQIKLPSIYESFSGTIIYPYNITVDVSLYPIKCILDNMSYCYIPTYINLFFLIIFFVKYLIKIFLLKLNKITEIKHPNYEGNQGKFFIKSTDFFYHYYNNLSFSIIYYIWYIKDKVTCSNILAYSWDFKVILNKILYFILSHWLILILILFLPPISFIRIIVFFFEIMWNWKKHVNKINCHLLYNSKKDNKLLFIIRNKLLIILFLNTSSIYDEKKIFILNNRIRVNNYYWKSLNSIQKQTILYDHNQLSYLCKYFSMNYCTPSPDKLLTLSYARIKGDSGAFHPTIDMKWYSMSRANFHMSFTHNNIETASKQSLEQPSQTHIEQIGSNSQSYNDMGKISFDPFKKAGIVIGHKKPLSVSDFEYNGKVLLANQDEFLIWNEVQNYLMIKNEVELTEYQSNFSFKTLTKDQDKVVKKLISAWTDFEEYLIKNNITREEDITSHQINFGKVLRAHVMFNDTIEPSNLISTYNSLNFSKSFVNEKITAMEHLFFY